MIFGLVRLIILSYITVRKSISRDVRVSATHSLSLQVILVCKKLSNKQSGIMIFKPFALITL